MVYQIKNGIKEKKEEKFLVKTLNLTKIFGRGDLAVRVLFDINLEIKEGDFIAIAGPSGSGKTTLLNMIGVLDRPTSGEVIIDGIFLSKVKESELYKIRREKVGFIFQNYYLIPTLNTIQNILIPTFPLKSKKDYLTRARILLSKVGLEGKEHRRPSQLSSGEQQRVAIARSLILDPILVLADEPTGNLDSKTGMEIVNLMQKLNQKEKKTFLIVTHDFKIAKLCQRIIYLEDGKISKACSSLRSK